MQLVLLVIDKSNPMMVTVLVQVNVEYMVPLMNPVSGTKTQNPLPVYQYHYMQVTVKMSSIMNAGKGMFVSSTLIG